MSEKKIFLSNPDKANTQSFLVTRSFSDYWKMHERYIVFDQANNRLGVFYIRAIQHCLVKDITNYVSFLDKNCNSDLHKQCLLLDNNKFKDLESRVMILIFSNKNPLNEC